MERDPRADEQTPENVEPSDAEAVYGDTDMNPNADDQKDAHHAEADEHL